MFGDDAMPEEAVAKLGEHRSTFWAGMEKLLGDKKFFGGDKLCIGDFYVAAGLFSWERNTKGKESQAHVYAAHAAALAGNANMTAWADRVGDELKDYLAARGSGTI
jgi:glutathione S-transferase